MEKAASLVDRFRIVGTVLASLGRTVRCRVGIGGDRAGYVGWKIVSNEPLTTDIVREGSPSLLRSEVDKRIVKIRPMSTPIDQLSRWNGSRKASSMIVDYYSVDVKPTKSYMKASYVAPGASTVNDSHKKATINAVDNSIFEVSETLLVQGVKGYDPDGEMSNADLVLYIAAKTRIRGH